MPRHDDPGTAQEPDAAEGVWLEVQKQSIVTAPARVTEGGKQIITLSTVLAGAYFTAVAFATLGAIESWPLRIVHVLPILLWSAAILCAIRTVVPVKEYGTTLGDALSGKSLFVETVLSKLVWLRLGLLFQLAGIVAMLVVLWLRLSGLSVPGSQASGQ